MSQRSKSPCFIRLPNAFNRDNLRLVSLLKGQFFTKVLLRLQSSSKSSEQLYITIYHKPANKSINSHWVNHRARVSEFQQNTSHPLQNETWSLGVAPHLQTSDLQSPIRPFPIKPHAFPNVLTTIH